VDAVRPAPVEDGVEVVLQDPVLRPPAVEPDGETGLDRLPLERDLVPDVEVADELLRERRAPLDDLAGADVLRERTRDPLEVDAAVLVEAAILDRDRGQSHPLADPVQLHRLAVLLRGDRAEQRAVCRVDERVLPDLHRAEAVEVAAGRDRRGARDPRCPDRTDDEHEGGDQQGKLAAMASLGAAPVAPRATAVGLVLELVPATRTASSIGAHA
jgi:hypothetical protein